MEQVAKFFEEMFNSLMENPNRIWYIGLIVGVILVLVIMLVAINKKKKQRSTEGNETRLIKETLLENENETTDDVVEELEENEDEELVVEEAPIVEEPTTEEAVVEETPKKRGRKPKAKVEEQVVEETPVIEEVVVEEPTTEEVVVEETPKKRGRKPKAKVEEQVVEETPVIEEVVVEEPVTEEVVVEETPKKQRVVYGKYEVYSDGSSYYYNLKASNGEILIKSGAYASRESVLIAIEAIKRNVEVGTITVRQDKHGLFQFVLTAKNHRTLVMSANYSTEKRATSASESFKRFASNSPVVELAEIVESNKEEVILDSIVDKKGGKIGIVTADGGYYYILKASNGEVLVQSDLYKTLISVESSLKRFQEAVFSGKFFLEKDKRGKYQFKLFAANGRFVCAGQIYATKSLAIANINSICSFVKLATNIEE